MYWISVDFHNRGWQQYLFWNYSDGDYITGAGTNSLSLLFNTPGSKFIRINYTNEFGCRATGYTTREIIINPLPTATISGTTAVCQNAEAPSITFTGAGGTAPYTFNYTLNDGTNTSSASVTTETGNSVTVSVPTSIPGTFT